MNQENISYFLGKKVGVLRYRDHDAYVVSSHGGKIVRNDDSVTDFKSDVLQLIAKLERNKIDGFVLDAWTLEHATELFADNDDVDDEEDDDDEDDGEDDDGNKNEKLIAFFFTQVSLYMQGIYFASPYHNKNKSLPLRNV